METNPLEAAKTCTLPGPPRQPRNRKERSMNAGASFSSKILSHEIKVTPPNGFRRARATIARHAAPFCIPIYKKKKKKKIISCEKFINGVPERAAGDCGAGQIHCHARRLHGQLSQN